MPLWLNNECDLNNFFHFSYFLFYLFFHLFFIIFHFSKKFLLLLIFFGSWDLVINIISINS